MSTEVPMKLYRSPEVDVHVFRVYHQPCISEIFATSELGIPDRMYSSIYGLKKDGFLSTLVSWARDVGMEMLPVHIKSITPDENGMDRYRLLIVLPRYSAGMGEIVSKLEEKREQGIIDQAYVWASLSQYVMDLDGVRDGAYITIHSRMLKHPFVDTTPFLGVKPNSNKSYDFFVVQNLSGEESVNETIDEIYRKLREIGKVKKADFTINL